MTPQNHDDERQLLEAILTGLAILVLFFIVMNAYWLQHP